MVNKMSAALSIVEQCMAIERPTVSVTFCRPTAQASKLTYLPVNVHNFVKADTDFYAAVG